MDRRCWMGSVASCALATGLSSAAAQGDGYFIRDRNVSVVDRVQAYNRSEGMRTGSFVVRPQLDIGAGWTSNVFALSDSGLAGLEFAEDESALFGFVRASVAAASDWNRHEIRFDAYTEAAGNERFDSETFVTAGASLGGTYDIDRASALFGSVSYDSLREGRGVNNTFLLAEEPVAFDLVQAEAGLRRELGRARAEIRFDLADYDYDDVRIVPIPAGQRDSDGVFRQTLDADGAPVFVAQGEGDQDFRDHTAYRATAEAAYALSPDTALLVRGQLERREFDGRDGFGLDRDSDGFRVAAGAEFDLTRLVRGEVTIGYYERDFEDVRFEDASGIGIDIGIEWFATALTTLTVTASRDIEESPFIGAGGVVREELATQVDHELRRNVHLYALAGIGRDEYDDLDRTFDRFRAEVGARYYVNDNVSIGASYDYLSQHVNAADPIGAFGAPYDQHRALITITLVP